MMLQAARQLPGVVHLGGFIAQTPAVTLTERTVDEILTLLKRLAPAELVGAHLFHQAETAALLSDVSRFLHVFLYRDPREVVVSETDYLTHVHKYHRMHNAFAGSSSARERYDMAIYGVPGTPYCSARERIEPYTGWLNDSSVLALKYEDLAGDCNEEAYRRLVDRFLASRPETNVAPEVLTSRLLSAIAPGRSRTFRRGGTEKWRSELTDDQQSALTLQLDDLITRMGYQL